VAQRYGCGCKWRTTWRKPASTKARLRCQTGCRTSWKSGAREAKPERRSVRRIDIMLISTAIGAGDRLPVGCTVLVIVLLSLLLWAVLWLLLWRLFGTEGVADLHQNIKRRLVIRSCFSAIHSGRRG
jgi:hypothetical protein